MCYKCCYLKVSTVDSFWVLTTKETKIDTDTDVFCQNSTETYRTLNCQHHNSTRWNSRIPTILPTTSYLGVDADERVGAVVELLLQRDDDALEVTLRLLLDVARNLVQEQNNEVELRT